VFIVVIYFIMSQSGNFWIHPLMLRCTFNGLGPWFT